MKALRARLGLSQTAFADTYGFEAGTIRNWEQKRRGASLPLATRAYLAVIAREPRIVARAVQAAKREGKL